VNVYDILFWGMVGAMALVALFAIAWGVRELLR
jgi:hypothetical protein